MAQWWFEVARCWCRGGLAVVLRWLGGGLAMA
jgi:hypothetical protein